MIPEIDTLDKYKNYMHGGLFILLFLTVVAIFYSIYFDAYSWQTFAFRMVGLVDIFVMYVVAIKALNLTRRVPIKIS